MVGHGGGATTSVSRWIWFPSGRSVLLESSHMKWFLYILLGLAVSGGWVLFMKSGDKETEELEARALAYESGTAEEMDLASPVCCMKTDMILRYIILSLQIKYQRTGKKTGTGWKVRLL